MDEVEQASLVMNSAETAKDSYQNGTAFEQDKDELTPDLQDISHEGGDPSHEIHTSQADCLKSSSILTMDGCCDEQEIELNTTESELCLCPSASHELGSDFNDSLLQELDSALVHNNHIKTSSQHCDECNSPTVNPCDVKNQVSDSNQSELQNRYDVLQKMFIEREVTIKSLEEQVNVTSGKCQELERERDNYRSRTEELVSKGQQEGGEKQSTIEQLERAIEDRKVEIEGLKNQFANREIQAKKYYTNIQADLQTRLSQVTRAYEEVQKEKQDMVVKYATAEAKNIELQEKITKAEKKVKDSEKDREQAQGKTKQLKTERQKMEELFQTRNQEIINLRRDIERLKEIRSEAEAKAKLANLNLKTEQEGHRACRAKLEEVSRRLKQSKEESESVRKECEALVKQYQDSTEEQSQQLEQQTAASNEQQELQLAVRTQLEGLKAKHKDLIEELKTYRDRVICLEAERLHQEETLTKFKETLQGQKGENRALQDRLEVLLDIEQDRDRAYEARDRVQARCTELEELNSDLRTDMSGCAAREAEHLEFTNRVSDRNASLLSENTTLQTKTTALEEQCTTLQREKQQHCEAIARLEEQLKTEGEQYRAENTALRTKVDERSLLLKELTQQLDDQTDENKTLRRKHIANIKDLTRQLQQAKRRLDNNSETSNGQDGSMGSRTSSNNSLDTVGRQASPPETSHTVQEDNPPTVQIVEVDKQTLIEKIVRLQRAHARKNEKMEFLEDHVSQLIEEMKKKTRLLQNYALREETGSLAPEAMDLNKVQMAKKSGIMASMYSSHVQDGHMTLELSLQINRKLQAVLEDTLLKNITLKENLDTLGKEIARLSQDHRDLQLNIQQHGSSA